MAGQLGGRGAVERVDADGVDPARVRLGDEGRRARGDVEDVAAAQPLGVEGKEPRVFGQGAAEERDRRQLELQPCGLTRSRLDRGRRSEECSRMWRGPNRAPGRYEQPPSKGIP